jgi:hypothetical protein
MVLLVRYQSVYVYVLFLEKAQIESAGQWVMLTCFRDMAEVRTGALRWQL